MQPGVTRHRHRRSGEPLFERTGDWPSPVSPQNVLQAAAHTPGSLRPFRMEPPSPRSELQPLTSAHLYRHRQLCLSTNLIDKVCSPSRCVVVKEYVGDLNTRHSRTGGSLFWLASAFPLLRVASRSKNRRRFVLSKSVLVIAPSIDACLFQNSINTSASHEPEEAYPSPPCPKYKPFLVSHLHCQIHHLLAMRPVSHIEREFCIPDVRQIENRSRPLVTSPLSWWR